jgi:hypothetical protein
LDALAALALASSARSSANRQPSKPTSCLLEYHNGTCVEIGLQDGEVREQELKLPFWSPLGSVSEKDDRRTCLLLRGEQRSEIGICRDHDARFDRGLRENLLIGRSLHGVVANMDGVVAGRS